MSIQKVLVIGGTGMLGKPVVEKLAREGYEVAIGNRSKEKAREIFGDRFPIVELDVTDKKSVTPALVGFDAIHLSLPSGPQFEDCFRVETGGAKVIARAAFLAEIKRISYLSGTAVSSVVDFPPSKAKWQAEEAIKKSEVPYTIWRATWFMETLTKLVRFGTIALPGGGKPSAHWLAGRDLGKMVAEAFRNEEAVNKTFYLFGPDELTLGEAARIFRKTAYPGRPIVSAPLPVVTEMGKSLNNWEMWFGAQMMKFLKQVGETGDPSEARRILGSCETTVAEFAEQVKTERDKKSE